MNLPDYVAWILQDDASNTETAFELEELLGKPVTADSVGAVRWRLTEAKAGTYCNWDFVASGIAKDWMEGL